MEFKVENGPVFTILRIIMSRGEEFRAEAGAMISMSPTIEVEAKASGKGFFGAVKAAIGGESVFTSLYTAEKGDGELILAPSAPGDILRYDMNGNTIFAQGGAYLAGSSGLELSAKGSIKALISGEELFLQKISGNGIVFITSYGAVYEKALSYGETYIVDTGHIVAFDETVQYRLKKVSKGILSSLASGEGLVCEFQGPGHIWVQTRNIPALAKLISSFLPQNG